MAHACEVEIGRGDHTIQDLSGLRTSEMAACTLDGKRTKLVCTSALVLDAEMLTRHGTALTLRGVSWIVTVQTVGEPLLRSPIS